jgi:FkbM family methyltransferase
MLVSINSSNRILEDLFTENIQTAIDREQNQFDILSSPYSNSIILFGAGQLGKKTLNGLRELGIEPIAFIDNNNDLWGKSVDNLDVLSPSNAAKKYGKSAVFVMTIWRANSSHRQAHTRNQLTELGCEKIVSVAYLFWKYPETFLPHYCLDLPHKVYEQIDLVKAASSLWADERSQQEYIDQLRWRLQLDFDGLSSPVPQTQYFPSDLFTLSSQETFIDCGAYDGDTISTLIYQQQYNFQQIIAFEPDPQNYQKLTEYINELPSDLRSKITIHQLAASNQREQLKFTAMGTASSVVSTVGTFTVDAAPLDEILIDATPTFIKMDIEGAEIAALTGASKIIARDLPILAISAYHLQDHLWRIPLLIHSISSEYKLFLRPHGEECWDCVCYAIPNNRLHPQLN